MKTQTFSKKQQTPDHGYAEENEYMNEWMENGWEKKRHSITTMATLFDLTCH